MSRRSIFALLVPLLLVAAYFGISGYIRAHVNEQIQNVVNRPLPNFQLVDQAGKAWSKQDLQGKRVVLHFFRSHCHACDVEAPVIRELEREKSENTVWLHVMTDVVMDCDAATTAATIARKNFSQPILMADEAFMDLFHKAQWSQVTPITYVVDPSGTVRYALRGMQTKAEIEKAIDAVPFKA